MKITKRGRWRDVGRKKIAEENISTRKDIYSGPSWNGEGTELSIQLRGKDGVNNYVYDITLTPAELLKCLEQMPASVLAEKASTAVYMGAVASLGELLKPGEGQGQAQANGISTATA